MPGILVSGDSLPRFVIRRWGAIHPKATAHGQTHDGPHPVPASSYGHKGCDLGQDKSLPNRNSVTSTSFVVPLSENPAFVEGVNFGCDVDGSMPLASEYEL